MNSSCFLYIQSNRTTLIRPNHELLTLELPKLLSISALLEPHPQQVLLVTDGRQYIHLWLADSYFAGCDDSVCGFPNITTAVATHVTSSTTTSPAMRAPPPTMAPIIPTAPYRATPDLEEDSQSSSSNSPARADYEESDFYGANNDSQSSIGVPTFQDMAVTEESCLPPAARLPAEVLIGILAKLTSSKDLLSCMLVSKRWARNSVDLLWHRPTCTTWDKHSFICNTLTLARPYFAYRDFIKRLNLAALADAVSDGSVTTLAVCKRMERLTLTSCVGLTDSGLIGLIRDSNHLLALDISGDRQITEASMFALADNCPRLQGLNISGCVQISNKSMVKVAENCRFLKRVCAQVLQTS